MNIDYEDIYRFKRLDLPELLASYGIKIRSKPNGASFALCPFHDDKIPSLSVSRKADVWLWHCFACRIGGTVIDFVMKKEGLSLRETYRRLGELSGAAEPAVRSLGLLKEVADFYHKTFFEDKRGREYLKSRGIRSDETLRSFKVGFASGVLKKVFIDKHSLKSLKDLGVLNDLGNEVFYNSVTVPLFDQDGAVAGLYGRNVSLKRHLYLKGPHRGLLNRQGASGTRKVILTESVLDAMSLYELGVRNVLACYGTSGFTEFHKELLEKERVGEVEICFDNDTAGQAAARSLAARLWPLKIKCASVKFPEGVKDPNDFLTLGKTKPDYEALEKTALDPPVSLTDAGSQEYLFQKEGDAFILSAGERSYRVRLIDEDLSRYMRVNIRFSLRDSRPMLDAFDLASHRQRKLYAKRLSEIAALGEAVIEEDLHRLIEELEKLSAEKEKEGVVQIPPMSDEEKKEALAALKSADLIHEITRDLEALGCVGEAMNKLLGYIVTVSRRLDSPLSMIIVSQSGAGKSNLADTLEAVIPPEEAVRLSRITPQALYYTDKDALKRKVLLIEEKEGSEAADYSIRVLQSRKSLRLAVAMKDASSGKLRTVIFEVEGPVVVIETTTRSDLNPENTSRCFVVYLDESEEQTRRIHAYQRLQKTLEGARLKKESEKIIKKHRNMQRLLRPVIVTIPYAEKISFPSKWMRTRRDYAKFLNLIEAVAFLHQHQRPMKTDPEGAEYIEATIEDYRVAYALSKEAIGDTLSELAKPEREFYERLKDMSGKKGLQSFARRDIRDFTGIADHVIRQRLRALEDLEYVIVLDGKQGKLYEYKLNAQALAASAVMETLTTPKELEARLRGNFERALKQSYPYASNGVKAALTL